MLKTNVYNMSGKLVGEIELPEAVFGIDPNGAVGINAKHSFGQFDLANQLAGHIVNIRLKHDLRSPFLSLLRKPSGDFCRKPSAGSC